MSEKYFSVGLPDNIWCVWNSISKLCNVCLSFYLLNIKIYCFFKAVQFEVFNITLLLHGTFCKICACKHMQTHNKKCFLFNWRTVFEIRMINALFNTRTSSSTLHDPCMSSPTARTWPRTYYSWNVPCPRCPRGRNRGQRSSRRHCSH